MSAPGIIGASGAWRWPTVDIDVDLLVELSRRTVQPGNQYRLGGKAPKLTADSATIRGLGIDCSGYVRWILHRATGDELVIPDGSVQQAEWADSVGLKRSTVEACALLDGVVRMAQLPPTASRSGVGHITLILDGQTIESRGGAGPDRRPWTGEGWQALVNVWGLTRPE